MFELRKSRKKKKIWNCDLDICIVFLVYFPELVFYEKFSNSLSYNSWIDKHLTGSATKSHVEVKQNLLGNW